MANKKVIIGITAPALSGKDQIAQMLEEKHHFFWHAMANPVKVSVNTVLPPSIRRHYAMLGEDPSFKLDKQAIIPRLGVSFRTLWQRLGTEFGREMIHPDIWIMHLEDLWADIEQSSSFDGVVVSDIRYLNEAQFVRNKGGVIWRVIRPGLDLTESFRDHDSENGIPDHLVTRDFVNDGTLADLFHKVNEELVKMRRE